MSGPKISIYKLKGRQKEIALAILRCDSRCAEYYMSGMRLLKEMRQAETEIDASVELLKRLDAKYGGQTEKIQAALEVREDLGKELKTLMKQLKANRPVQRKIILSEEELQVRKERTAKLKELHERIAGLKKQTDQAVSAGKKKVAKRREEVLAVLNDPGEEKTESRTEQEKRQNLTAFLASLHADLFTEDTDQRAERMRSLQIPTENTISADLYRKLCKAQKRVKETEDFEALKSYYSLSVLPLVKQAEKEEELYRQKTEKWLALCELAEESREIPSFEEIDQAYEELSERLLEQQEREYIARCTDEVMKEMGYDLIGEKEAVKRSGKRLKSELYRFSEGTAVNVTYSGGQIAMEIGGLAEEDRLPENDETEVLVDAMEAFCSEFAVFERKMAERGIIVSDRIAKLPPDAEHASIININDYEMTQPAELLNVSRGRKEEEKKALYAKGE